MLINTGGLIIIDGFDSFSCITDQVLTFNQLGRIRSDQQNQFIWLKPDRIIADILLESLDQ